MNPIYKFFDKTYCRKVLLYFLLPFFVVEGLYAQGNQQEQGFEQLGEHGRDAWCSGGLDFAQICVTLVCALPGVYVSVAW